ncbi:MAG: glutamine--fructose-6-phosphate transaminase (isomerizing) [bacterium]
MCGIIGYIGKQNALPIIIDGLRRLEYRGYDSSGLVVFDKKKFQSIKAVGRIEALEKELENCSLNGNLGIGHSRWATHGSPNKINAHPHCDCKRKIWLVHNGIIENYKVLKESLEKNGHKIRSETDTEIVAHLIEDQSKCSLEEAVRKALKQINGTYALAVVSVDDPDKIVVARNSSPLLIGVGKDEYIIASDASAVVAYTKKVIYLDDGEIGVIKSDGFRIFNSDNHGVKKSINHIDWDIAQAQKKGFKHFMLKEIFEQPEAIENSLRGRLIDDKGLSKLGGLELVEDKLRKIKRLIIVACGTAFYAGLVGEYMMEEYAGLPVEVELASEFRYRKAVLDKNTALLAISQSGETADTLAAIDEAKRKGILTIGMVNTVGSSVARQTKAGVYNHIGPEIGVASTKAFTSQLSVAALLTLFLGRQRGMSLTMGQRIAKELREIPFCIKEILDQNKEIKRIVKKYSKYNNFLFLGRKYNYPIALEGALKLKEISYIHSEGYGAGEMKHGLIALIDENFPSICIAPSDSVYEKMVSNIEEIKARKGKVIAIATKGNQDIKKLVDDCIYIPKTLEMLTPILSVVPLQLFAYHMSVLRGCDVDKPRNLAKSVTVE